MKKEIISLLEELSVLKKSPKGLTSDEIESKKSEVIKSLYEQYKLVKRLVIVKLDAIGDSLLFTNFLKAARELFPTANITLTSYLETKEIADRCPYVDAKIYIDRNSFSVNKQYRENVITKLNELKYDMLINPLYSREYNSEQVSAFIDADIKICVRGDLSNITQSILNVTDKWYDFFLEVDKEKNKFELKRNAEIISLLGGNLDERILPEVWETEEDNQFINRFLKNYNIENYAVVFPGSKGGRQSIKYWGTEKYASLINYIQDVLKLNAVILGGVEDSEICNEIAMASKSVPILLSGHFPLWKTVSFLKHARFYVGSDTSIAHFSAALKIPTIVILGGGHFGRFFPYPNFDHVRAVYKKIPCYNCNWKCIKAEVECLKNISLNEVTLNCKEILKKYPRQEVADNKEVKQIHLIKERGSQLKIDLIVPPASNHSWHLKEGWIHSLKSRGILNNLFYVNEKYYRHFFEYLNTGGRSDLILALGGDHHLYFLNDSEIKQQMWEKYKNAKVCFSFESSRDTIYEAYRIRVNNALKIFTHYLVSDENDISLYKDFSKDVIWFPQFVDDKLFYQYKPFDSRQRMLFFKGKLWNEYEIRRKILMDLVKSKLCIVVDQFLSTSELISNYNLFVGTINPPGVFGGFNVRTFEALACGSLLFQFKPENRPLNNALFKDGKHLIYFEVKDIDNLVNKVELFLKNPDLYRHIAEDGHNEVLKYHTLEKRIDTFIDWITERKLPNYPNYSIQKIDVKENEESLQQLNTLSKNGETEIQVSAIVSTFNSEKFIQGCLDDLINQTLYNKGELEIIVINSGSQQNEEEIVKEYQTKFGNIKYIKTERETIYQAWNRGIKTASGKYITNANTDDRHRQDALEIMYTVLKENPNLDIVYADTYVTTKPNDFWESNSSKTETHWVSFDMDLILFGCFIGPQPMWKKELHEKYGYFKEDLHVVGDYEFWLRVSRTAKFRHIEKTLGLYFYSPESAEHKNKSLTVQENTNVQNEYLVKYIPDINEITRIKNKLAPFKNINGAEQYLKIAMELLDKRERGLNIQPSIAEFIKRSNEFAYEDLFKLSTDIQSEIIRTNPIIDPIYLENFYLILGINEYKANKLDEAKKQFNKAIKTNKNSANAYAGLGTIFLDMKDYKLAKLNFETAVAIDPNNNLAINGIVKSDEKINEILSKKLSEEKSANQVIIN